LERSKNINAAIAGLGKHPILKHSLWLVVAAWVYTLTFIFNNYWSQYASYKSVTVSFQQAITKKEGLFAGIANDTAAVRQLLTTNDGAPQWLNEARNPVDLFLYNGALPLTTPLFWSTSAVLPLPNDVLGLPTGSFVRYGNGAYEFLKKEVTIGGKPLVLVGLIQLQESFFIENAKLKRFFPGFSGLDGKMALVDSITAYPLRGTTGKTLCYLKPLVPQPIYVVNIASVVVECLVLFFLVIFVTRFCNAVVKHRRNGFLGLLSFGGWVLLLRFALLRFGVPINIGALPFFDHGGNESLALLLTNALFGFWFGLFVNHNRDALLHWVAQTTAQRWQWWLALVSLVLVGFQFLTVLLIRRLYLNELVAFDLTNFFSLDFSTVLSFLILFLFAVTHFLCTQLLMHAIVALQGSKLYRGQIAVATIGLLCLSLLLGKAYTVLLLFSLVWLLLIFAFVAFVARRDLRVSMPQSTLVMWMLAYAFSLALLLGMLSGNRLQSQTRQLAGSLLQQNDRTSEYALRIAAGNLRRIRWQVVARQCGASPVVCKQLQDSIIAQFFGGYLSRYNTSLFLFDAGGAFKGGTSAQTFESLNTLYGKQGVATAYEGLHYFGESFDEFGYIFKMPFVNPDNDQIEGWLFSITRTNNQQQPLAPELFRQLQDFAVDLPKGYSYAWYKNGVLVDQYRNYPFPSTIPGRVTGSMYQEEAPGLFALWMRASSNTSLALVAERRVLIGFMTLVAYVFGAFLMFYALLRALQLLWRSRLWVKNPWGGFAINLQTQIRATIVSMLLLSFVLIAVVTVLLFIGQFRTTNQERLAKTVQSVATSISQNLPGNFQGMAYGDKVELLKMAVFDATRSFNVDANVFSTSGALMATTQDFLFEKGVLSTMVQPSAWHQLSKGSINRFVANETIGGLKYTSIYQPLRSKLGQTIGFLQVPYFASQQELNQEISNFLVIIINIIAFVFLLSGSIAFLISARITKSFDLIGEKMKKLQLSATNERIDWERNDEIGNLVKQYNLMVDQLEAGAQKMAKTEREMAWREMARQVAHEIKNPLTPMKLSLQFLQNAISNKQANVADITNRVAANLVEQIDHLSKIAYDFSQFANLGNTRPEMLNADEVLESVLQLYSLRQQVRIERLTPRFEAWVVADRTQMNRLFTNIFQNAVEACEPGQPLHVRVAVSASSDHQLLFSISDDGRGIDAAIQPKIFVPNFTTKNGGTGLGLAICKAIAENAGGDIWFTTSAEGTTFFIKLPMPPQVPFCTA